MLVRVPTADVELGMYIHALDGPWLSNPFWRRRFLLVDPRDLAKLRASAVPAALIDDAKGRTPRQAAASGRAKASIMITTLRPRGLPPR